MFIEINRTLNMAIIKDLVVAIKFISTIKDYLVHNNNQPNVLQTTTLIVSLSYEYNAFLNNTQ